MRAIGKFTTVVALLAAGLGAVVAVRSIPDARRYLKMRRM